MEIETTHLPNIMHDGNRTSVPTLPIAPIPIRPPIQLEIIEDEPFQKKRRVEGEKAIDDSESASTSTSGDSPVPSSDLRDSGSNSEGERERPLYTSEGGSSLSSLLNALPREVASASVREQQSQPQQQELALSAPLTSANATSIGEVCDPDKERYIKIFNSLNSPEKQGLKYAIGILLWKPTKTSVEVPLKYRSPPRTTMEEGYGNDLRDLDWVCMDIKHRNRFNPTRRWNIKAFIAAVHDFGVEKLKGMIEFSEMEKDFMQQPRRNKTSPAASSSTSSISRQHKPHSDGMNTFPGTSHLPNSYHRNAISSGDFLTDFQYPFKSIKVSIPPLKKDSSIPFRTVLPHPDNNNHPHFSGTGHHDHNKSNLMFLLKSIVQLQDDGLQPDISLINERAFEDFTMKDIRKVQKFVRDLSITLNAMGVKDL